MKGHLARIVRHAAIIGFAATTMGCGFVLGERGRCERSGGSWDRLRVPSPECANPDACGNFLTCSLAAPRFPTFYCSCPENFFVNDDDRCEEITEESCAMSLTES